ncbi:Two-component response regulator-like PRR37 [Citrus sinensis]|uniref:two-component response regulator-like PRR37 isoform X5 n=1 Tax=Citrus sinensis TaxID=2711 RepID=UPI0003D76471|nr:two-component response regulator-like PRR37 isoform X5 [Citrus sinensis]KAH9703400.1 Two-component response regulator-like PRR37 [Citrus sinensis]
MGIVQMNGNGPVSNGLAELNHHMRDDHKQIRDGVTGEGQGLSEEDESRINEDGEDVNNGWVDEVQAQAQTMAALQGQQSQPERPLVCWERFLPLRSLKVLLVESDDSTRRVVCALLRNCGYEVIAVENGLQAWKILEDLMDQIDLVLTEVLMPCLSGIGLLRKIMNHKTCKNIPVIMMSSHDSMSIVFKCLSKGAVYFLVKPIRKNELQNLWQHVWRKYHSSSGSGSESCIMTQKSTKSKSAEGSDNNSGSNDEDDKGSIGLNIQDGSDNGSGTQSSWTKRAVEVDCPKAMSPWEQLADPPDSTCAQVIHSRPEACGNSWVPMTATKECKGWDDELGNVETDKDLKKDDEPQQTKKLELNSEKLNAGLRKQAADIAGVITNGNDSPIESVVFDTPNGLFKVSGTKEKLIYDHNEIPSLELSLKRSREDGDTGTHRHDRNVLRHSDLHSAFSRYKSASTANQASTGNVGSCSPLDNSSEAAKTNSIQNCQSNLSSTPPSQHSNVSNNNSDVGLTTNASSTNPTVFSDKPAPNSTIKSLLPSSATQPAQPIQGKVDGAVGSMAQERGVNQQVQVQHHHHHYHHCHHHVHNVPQQQLANHDMLLKKMAAKAPNNGSSNIVSAPIEGNAGNHSLNGSTSGSNHGSNGQSGSCTALNAEVENVESDNGVPMKGKPAGGVGYGSTSGVIKNRFAQREAALNKFRQKRKQRCFEKKVRYQSRKKLAEQRPRVRGQFVQQGPLENKGNSTVS